MTKPYRPSNCSEGDAFTASWCSNCARDEILNGSRSIDEFDDPECVTCDIVERTFAYDIDDPEYPTEWCYDQDGKPCCTAFVPAGEAILQSRCERTIDMFDSESSEPSRNP